MGHGALAVVPLSFSGRAELGRPAGNRYRTDALETFLCNLFPLGGKLAEDSWIRRAARRTGDGYRGGGYVRFRCFAVWLCTPALHLSDDLQEGGRGFARRRGARQHLYRLPGLRQGISLRLAADEGGRSGQERGLIPPYSLTSIQSPGFPARRFSSSTHLVSSGDPECRPCRQPGPGSRWPPPHGA